MEVGLVVDHNPTLYLRFLSVRSVLNEWQYSHRKTLQQLAGRVREWTGAVSGADAPEASHVIDYRCHPDFQLESFHFKQVRAAHIVTLG